MDKYIGKQLDNRYEIKELIGVGGMAYVYLAYDTIDARDVAVKILKDEYLTNEEFTRRFRNESKAVAILSHPNIVKVLDVSFGESMQYIVMEYIDGITLKEYIERQNVTWKEAVHFTVQILRALQHAHDKGIVHRDIKPQNIMLLADGTIKVTDFGIARFARNAVRTGLSDKAIGSVHYISPEQARGAFTDEKADIYSVGVMLYEMLTGQLPFEADNAVSVAIMQMQSQPRKLSEINPDIPEGLEEITLKAMQKEPSKRYQSAAEMLQDIQDFKQNPSIHFEYTYLTDENPTRFVEAIASIKGTKPTDAVEVDEDEDEEAKFPLIPVLIAAGSALAVVALIVVIILGFSMGWFGGGASNTVQVPNFVGRNFQDLTADELKNFSDVKREYENNAKYGKDVIISQDPPANRTVKAGQKVLVLTISNGPKEVELPTMEQPTKEDVIVHRLQKKGLVPKVYQESSDTVEKGYVIRLEAAATPVVEGTTVYVYVSSGEEEREPVKVGNVVGKDLSAAIKALNDQEFVVNENKVIRENSNKPAGTVLAQDPAAGSMLSPGKEVILTVSSGCMDVEVLLPLPNIDDAIDLQVYVDGQFSKTYSKGLTGLLPADVGYKKFTFSEMRDDPYVVTFQIAFAGTGEYTTYYKYEINEIDGTADIMEQHPFRARTTTAAPTTQPTTQPTAATTQPTEATQPTAVAGE